jgi:hypothetical protein
VRLCLIHICHAMPMPCSNHTVLLKATAQHASRVDGLWATCALSASFGYHADFHEGCYQKHTISDPGGQCENKQRLSWTKKRVVAAHYKKRRSVKLLN